MAVNLPNTGDSLDESHVAEIIDIMETARDADVDLIMDDVRNDIDKILLSKPKESAHMYSVSSGREFEANQSAGAAILARNLQAAESREALRIMLRNQGIDTVTRDRIARVLASNPQVWALNQNRISPRVQSAPAATSQSTPNQAPNTQNAAAASVQTSPSSAIQSAQQQSATNVRPSVGSELSWKHFGKKVAAGTVKTAKILTLPVWFPLYGAYHGTRFAWHKIEPGIQKFNNVAENGWLSWINPSAYLKRLFTTK